MLQVLQEDASSAKSSRNISLAKNETFRYATKAYGSLTHANKLIANSLGNKLYGGI